MHSTSTISRPHMFVDPCAIIDTFAITDVHGILLCTPSIKFTSRHCLYLNGRQGRRSDQRAGGHIQQKGQFEVSLKNVFKMFSKEDI